MALYKKTKRLAKILISFAAIMLLFYFSYNFFVKLSYPLKYKKEVVKAANFHHVDKYLLLAIIREESRFDQNSVSEKGAVGLMQLMPKTADWISEKRELPASAEKLSDPGVNIDNGTWYINYLFDRYKNNDVALAAYNSGTTVTDRWLSDNPGGDIKNFIYAETRDYVIRVNKSKQTYEKLYEENDFE